MKKIQEYLIKGDARAAVDRLVEAVKAQPEKAEPMADAMHELLKRLYRGYYVRSVHECARLLEEILSPEAHEVIVGDLKAPMERTRHWYGELRPIRHERLLREIRAAITRDADEQALALSRQFLGEARSDPEKQQFARQLIRALGGLVRDQKRSAALVQALMTDPQLGPFETNLMQGLADAIREESRGSLKETEREWTQALNAATVSLLEFLPAKNAAGEPSDEDLDRFCLEIESLLRSGLARGRLDDLVDALRIMIEFAPTDPSSLPSLVGVEERAFLGLGPKAKLTAVRGLDRIGENDRLRACVIELAKAPANRGRIAMIAAAMGGLRHVSFFPYLKAALDAVPTGSREEEVVIDALGRIGATESSERILGLLQEVMNQRKKMRAKVLDPSDVKRAGMLLTALGRIGRAKGFDPGLRNTLVERVIEVVGDTEPQISLIAADQMFSLRLGELDRPLKIWAVQQAVRSLFARDSGRDLKATAGSPLGFRQPIVALINRLGTEMLPEICAEAQPMAPTYGGGLQAFGESMAKIGDERALPVLEIMSRAAFMHDDGPGLDSVLKEQIGDAATGQARALTRDDVLHSLLFAIEKTGGEKGKRLLLQFADQVQSGQYASPGNEVASILTRAKREAGTLGSMEAEPVSDAPPVSEEEFRDALASARPGLLRKPAKRIPAIAQLGRARRNEGLRVLVECLGDKDTLVFRAAETALTECATPPPPPEKYEAFLLALFEDEKHFKGDLLERLIELIGRTFPKREPYDEIFRRSVGRYISDEVAAHRLKGCMVQAASSAPKADGEDGNGEISGYDKRMNEMEKKRVYLEQRRAWIASGKKGPPPEMPSAEAVE